MTGGLRSKTVLAIAASASRGNRRRVRPSATHKSATILCYKGIWRWRETRHVADIESLDDRNPIVTPDWPRPFSPKDFRRLAGDDDAD